MVYKLKTLSKAEADIAEALEWYLEIEPSIAARFLEELNNSFKLLLDFSGSFSDGACRPANVCTKDLSLQNCVFG